MLRPMTEQISGTEFHGVVAGGAAAGGSHVWVTLRLGGSDTTVIMDQSRVGILMSALAAAAGMARDERVRNGGDPVEDAGYALTLSGAGAGQAGPDTAILELLCDAGGSKPMNLLVAAERSPLMKLRAACDRALQLLDRISRPSLRN